MPHVSVIVVNYNAGDRIERCLKMLTAQSYQDFEVIIVDNASSDDSLVTARKAAPTAVLIENSANLGFAAANNIAASVAAGEWLAFLNPDAYPAPDWLEMLLDATTRFPWADAFGSTQIDAADPEVIDGAGDVFHVFGIPYRGHYGWPVSELPPEGECFAPCAAAALYRASVFRALGGFDDSFFCYGEDVDLGFRLRLAGGRAVQVAGAIVHHEGSGISGRYSEFTVYHGNRNRIWTVWKNMPGVFFWPLLPLQILTNLYLLARSFSMGVGPAFWRAVRDGYAAFPALAARRSDIQRARRVRLADLARALTWSPLKVSRREANLRAIPVMDASGASRRGL